MSTQYNVTLVTGPAGGGKSTLIKLLRHNVTDDPRRIVNIDSSKCLENSRNYASATGLRLMNLLEDQAEGRLLPAKLVVQSVMENLEWIRQRRIEVLHYLIAGCPRTQEEVQEWIRISRGGGITFRVLIINCTKEQLRQGIESRINQGITRADDNAIEQRWNEYLTKTRTIQDILKNDMFANTSRSDTLVERLRTLVNLMDIPSNVRSRWMRRLDEKTHPVHREIQNIESGNISLPIQVPARKSFRPLEYSSMQQHRVAF